MQDTGFFDPQVACTQMGVCPGMSIADFGSGSGEIAIKMAKVVGEKGTITALDVMTSALESVQAKAKHEGLQNIVPVRANLEIVGGSKLADSSQDGVFLANILWQSQKKSEVLAEAARVLKHNGTLAAIEWKKDAKGLGPPDELRISQEDLQALIKGAGLTFVSIFAGGDFHYGLLAKKP